MKNPTTHPRVPDPPERAIQGAILDWLTTVAGIPVGLTDAARSLGPDGRPRRRVSTGWPDLSAVGPGGRFVAIECKARAGRLRPEQKAMLGQLRAAGALVVVARSLGDVVDALASLCPEGGASADVGARRISRAIEAFRRGVGAP